VIKSRRGFLAALMALPTAAMAVLRGPKLHSGGIAPNTPMILPKRDCHSFCFTGSSFLLEVGDVVMVNGERVMVTGETMRVFPVTEYTLISHA
jgi:hypothetical protein